MHGYYGSNAFCFFVFSITRMGFFIFLLHGLFPPRPSSCSGLVWGCFYASADVLWITFLVCFCFCFCFRARARAGAGAVDIILSNIVFVSCVYAHAYASASVLCVSSSVSSSISVYVHLSNGVHVHSIERGYGVGRYLPEKVIISSSTEESAPR
jgi:hypothetical protein